MKNQINHIIYTIGHSTHSISIFVQMLQSYSIQTLVDVRSIPGSNKYPQFNKELLRNSLLDSSINYIHLLELGGRRKVNKNSHNNRWHNNSFRAYADYMETTNFTNAISELQSIANNSLTAYMCAESLWWRCHRSMISDYLKSKGWVVYHIMGIGKTEEHKYTEPAKLIDNMLVYYDN